MDSPFSMASRPRFRVAASNGPTSGFGRWLMAMPQKAMAQLGSVSGMAENVLTVSGKKNECNMASARSNCFWAPAEHDVLNSTRPSFSGLRALLAGSTSAITGTTSSIDSRPAATALRRDLIVHLLDDIGELVDRFHGRRHMGRPGTGHEKGSRSADYRRGEPAALHVVHRVRTGPRNVTLPRTMVLVDGIGDDPQLHLRHR